ncbi:hypothetical protein [Flagellimonas algicola]|uniref:Uncharacterized protein n=1 Tax=Flagellimonas algicola TaxID=2583815 RepID=A0ABY2WP80_9FLAO|nr:hypothetical protein [Allomuricauda algicola]TMU56472.1 hypothetical protein FGG15_02735 [Allomuricauda algicola]
MARKRKKRLIKNRWVKFTRNKGEFKNSNPLARYKYKTVFGGRVKYYLSYRDWSLDKPHKTYKA